MIKYYFRMKYTCKKTFQLLSLDAKPRLYFAAFQASVNHTNRLYLYPNATDILEIQFRKEFGYHQFKFLVDNHCAPQLANMLFQSSCTDDRERIMKGFDYIYGIPVQEKPHSTETIDPVVESMIKNKGIALYMAVERAIVALDKEMVAKLLQNPDICATTLDKWIERAVNALTAPQEVRFISIPKLRQILLLLMRVQSKKEHVYGNSGLLTAIARTKSCALFKMMYRSKRFIPTSPPVSWAFLQAVRENQIDIVRYLLKKCPISTYTIQQAFNNELGMNSLDMASLLIQDMKIEPFQALDQAVEDGLSYLIGLILNDHRTTKDWLQSNKQTDMIISCLWTGNLASAVNIFLDHPKVNVSANSEELLLRAVSLSDSFLVSTLLDYKRFPNLDPNARQHEALKTAICTCNLQIFSLLLLHPKTTVPFYLLSLACGAIPSSIDIVKLLVARVSPQISNLEEAIKAGNADIVYTLLCDKRLVRLMTKTRKMASKFVQLAYTLRDHLVFEVLRNWFASRGIDFQVN